MLKLAPITNKFLIDVAGATTGDVGYLAAIVAELSALPAHAPASEDHIEEFDVAIDFAEGF